MSKDTRRLHCIIEGDLHYRVRREKADSDETITEITEQALRRELDRRDEARAKHQPVSEASAASSA